MENVRLKNMGVKRCENKNVTLKICESKDMGLKKWQ